MLKKKGKPTRGGLTGTEQAAIAARQAGLLDAYTENLNTTNNLSESDKFKEGYVKKGGKKKERKSESEDVKPKEEPPKEEVELESWDDEEPVESWEDIEAPVMPLPTKVKQEQRKQEKQRKKAEERRSKDNGDQDPVEAVASDLEKTSLHESPKPNVALDLPSGVRTGTEAENEGGQADPSVVQAEREAKKAAKAAAKANSKLKKGGAPPENLPNTTNSTPASTAAKSGGKEKTKEQLQKDAEKEKRKAEFEAKRAAEQAAAGGEQEKTKADLKAERRAKQEAQRAAKTQAQDTKKPQKVRIPDEIQADQAKAEKKLAKTLASQNIPQRTKASRSVPLFSHLHQYEKDNSITKDLPVVGSSIHPSVIQLGLQLCEGKGSEGETRCLELLRALEDVLVDCVNDIKDKDNSDLFKEFDSALKPNLTFLKQCRPLSVSMSNAVRTIKSKLKTLDRSLPLDDLVAETRSTIDDFVEENLNLAARQISNTANTKIQNGDVILTYSCSLLVERLLVDAAATKSFKVVVTDGRVHFRGSEMAERLVAAGIDTTYILLSAVGQVLPAVTKVFLGCEGVMANGCVFAEVGTSQVALLGSSAGIPVLVCCQTFKFTERVQTDSFVYNELRDPDQVANTPNKSLDNWRDMSCIHLLNLVYDVTPASMVSAVITELSVIPTTSVPVILRLKNLDGHLGS